MRRIIGIFLGLIVSCKNQGEPKQHRLEDKKPLIIAHRGASGYLPEHTLEAYQKAIDLGADYIEPDFPMNHSVMIYSHDSPATRENWNSLTKTIVSSSVTAGTTSFEINHSSYQIEREIYYSVTLLFETSEDTRFIGNNTLTEPVYEDNTAPLFIGELIATFDANTAMTTLDWEEGIDDEIA